MAKITNQPITIPSGINIQVSGGQVDVSGPRGSLAHTFPPQIKIVTEADKITISGSDSPVTKALVGTTRSILANMIKGVIDGWSKTLEISGTGFRAASSGDKLTLALGFSHPVVVEAPGGVKFEVNENKITVLGTDKILVGDVAASIRKIRPADPYKAKGLKYLDERVRRKVGKAAKAVGAATGGK